MCLSEDHARRSRSKAVPVYFRWGSLRFGFHGICASASFVTTTLALLLQNNLVLLGASVVLNLTTALDARSLIDQVPLKTEIVPGIVAPHREAFVRTMSMMHYGNIRILGKLLGCEETPLYKSILWAFAWYNFLPLKTDFKNGNTWIFVVPMFLGVTMDMLQLLFRSVVMLEYYLLIELSALLIAFWFTLAFRGYVSVPQIYLGSALFVAALFAGLVYVIFM